MPDTSTGAPGAQAAPDTQPPAGDSSAQAADGDDGQSSSESISLDEARKLRSENQTLRKRLKPLEEAEQKRADADKTATERIAELERLNAEHERERSDWQTREAVTRSATKLGFVDPVDAIALLDRSAIELDDNGAPKNIDKLLTGLLTAKPYLGGAGRPTGSADGGNRGAPAAAEDMNTRLRRAAGRA